MKNKLENIIYHVAQIEFVFRDNRSSITITVDLTAITSNDDIDQAIDRADKLLYLGKEKGKNQLVV